MSTLTVTNPVEPGDVLTAVVGAGALPALATLSAGGLGADQLGSEAIRREHLGALAVRASDALTLGAPATFPAAPSIAWQDVLILVPVAAVLPLDAADELVGYFNGNVQTTNPNVLSASDLYAFRILVTFTDATFVVLGPAEARYSMANVPQSAALDNSTGLWDQLDNQRFLTQGTFIKNTPGSKTILDVRGQVLVFGGATAGVSVVLSTAELIIVRRQVG